MTSEPNPYAPPAEGPAPQPSFEDQGLPDRELSLVDASKRRWLVGIWPDRLRLLPLDGSPARVLDHRAFVAQTSLLLTGFQRSLVLTAPKARLQLEPRDLSALRAWIEPVLADHFARSLAKRRRVTLAIAVVFIVVGGLGVPWGSIDLPNLALGLVLLAGTVAAWLKPRRVALLLECAIWGLIGLRGLRGVAGGDHPLFLVCVGGAVMVMAGNVDEYRFYAPLPAR